MAICVLLSGCASSGFYNMSDSWCAEHQASENRCPGQSWDQESLKRNDHGCPTAIYIAPGGELQQCP